MRTEAIEADDELHPLDPAEWWAIETLWFAFTVPERALNGVVYLVCRPSMGVSSLQINIFDQSGHLPWENRHWRALWHLPMPASLRRFEMVGTGFAFEVLEPLTRYRLSYAAENVSFDLDWEALIPPRLTNGNHIDQFGRVTGTLRLDGEEIAVDCMQMRDRSWSRRSDLEGIQGAYTYALASGEHALLMASALDGEVCRAKGGWLLRDGHLSELAEGTRAVIKRGVENEPLEVEMRGIDRDGRSFTACGRSISRSVMHTSGNILAWDSLMEWSLDGTDCWGEDQDVWTPRSWPRPIGG